MRRNASVLAILSVFGAGLTAEDAPHPDVARARAAFQSAAQRVYEEILTSMDGDARREVERVLGCEGRELAAKAAEILVTSSGAFAMTDDEARAIVAGTFDDKANENMAQTCAKRLSGLGVQLPYLFSHLAEKVQSKQITSGIDLELAARLLSHHTARAQRIADAKRLER